MSKVSLPLKGACHCGALTYEITQAPLVIYACHCKNCQRISGSAFAISIIILTDYLKRMTGKSNRIEWVADSGNKRFGDFCADCGTRISHGSLPDGEMLVVRGGTLDDASWLSPTAHIWTKSAQKWFQFTDDDLKYDAQPPDYQPLLAKFKALDLFEG